MGFFSKLAFWKKDDDLGLDNFGSSSPDPNMDMGFANQDMSHGMPDMTNFRGVGNSQQQQAMNQSISQQLGNDYMGNDSSSGFSSFSPRQQPAYAQPQVVPASNPEMQLVSAKLDAIKAMIDSVNQRLANLERVAYADQQQPKRRDSW